MIADRVIGRDQELTVVAGLLERVTDGCAGLVLRGEAGIGKTTLWRAGVELARERSFRVLVASPSAAETAMSFAAVGDLLGGVVDEVLPGLPGPQRRALEVALLLADAEGPAADHRAVAVAFFNALGALSVSEPLLVAVDDVQWLDAASASVLGYAARRLRAQRVGLLLAERSAGAAGLPLELDRALAAEHVVSLSVGPLTLGALSVLVRRHLGFAPPRPVLVRIHETAAGNPFYGLELARALDREGVSAAPGEPLSLPASLDELVRDRIVTLPSETRETLLVAAALSEPRLAVLTAAVGADARRALRPAVEEELISVDGERIRFAHPLLAAAAYKATGDAERRAVHRRLALVVDDLEERARHLALAAEGPDADVAEVLERGAEHARARGASAAAAELCEQARRLTPPDDQDDAQRRTLAAARYRFLAGDTGSARALLEEALPAASQGQARAEVLVLLARLHRFEGDQPRAAELLRQALAEAGADDRVRAEAGQGLAATLFYMREELEAARRHAALAAELAARAGAPDVRTVALSDKGFIEALLGCPEAVATLRAARERRDVAEPLLVVDSPGHAWGHVQCWTDRHEDAVVSLRECHQAAVALGDESSVAMIFAGLAVAMYLTGRWQEAAGVAEQGYELALQTGQRPQQAYSRSVRALVGASLGLEAEARADAREALALAGERGMGVARIVSLWALGLLELSLDRPHQTARLLGPERERLLAAGVGEPGTIRFVPDEIEALVALGRLDEAERLVGWLDQRGGALDRASALAAAWRCRGMLLAARGDGPSAVMALERALDEHDRVSIPFERGRSLLALGMARRRLKRKRAARETLEDALATFERLGAGIWASQTRRELERISGRAPSRDELTPTERRVIELVADGRTNKEVAAALFVSPRTVEFHLRNVFRKLHMHSRAELVRRFASPVS